MPFYFIFHVVKCMLHGVKRIFHGAKCTFHGAKRNFLPLSFTFIKGFLLFSVHSFDHFFANQPTKATPTANSFSLLYIPLPKGFDVPICRVV